MLVARTAAESVATVFHAYDRHAAAAGVSRELAVEATARDFGLDVERVLWLVEQTERRDAENAGEIEVPDVFPAEWA